MSKKPTHNRHSGKYKHCVPVATKHYIAFDDQQLSERRDQELLSPEIDTRHAICRPKDASREDDDENIPDEEFEDVPNPLARRIFTGREAFTAFLAQLKTRRPKDKSDLVTLFFISIWVRLKEGRPVSSYGTAPFADRVFCDARVSAVDRPKLWIKRELNSIVELMVTHGA
ncbi:hypothetical protein [Sinorhizobium sp. CCBAU 05631]|uniref:hypothetical protein n=1 Tax=Sinorhizobium sp. CCBAU 05631 TaxID=794846 RepID=UPI000563ADCA|nr:hypothetical protein [Sinorhizobium sp. CCBAU 05631]ASY58279.1 hypothetical protein SS05631_c33650 [Sinorhizobium sp. CCBAU 05631]